MSAGDPLDLAQEEFIPAAPEVGSGTLAPSPFNFVFTGEDFLQITSRNGKSGVRIPEIVDTERTVARSHLRDDPRHHGDALQRRLQLVRAVAFVAEEDRVEPGPREELDISSHGLDDRPGTPGLVVQRRSGQRRQVCHRDDGLVDPEELLQIRWHVHMPSNRTP